MDFEVGNVKKFGVSNVCNPSDSGDCQHKCYVHLRNHRPVQMNLSSQKILETLNSMIDPETPSYFRTHIAERAKEYKTKKEL